MTRQCGSYAQNSWYLIRSKPCQEDRAKQHLVNIGVDVVLPVYTTKQSVKPLFPGYLFGNFPPDLFYKVNNAFGVRKIVRFGSAPATVDERVIGELRRRMGTDGNVDIPENKMDTRFHRGDMVDVVAGPLAGFRGVFDSELSGGERVRILLNTVNFRNSQQFGAHAGIEVGKNDLMLA